MAGFYRCLTGSKQLEGCGILIPCNRPLLSVIWCFYNKLVQLREIELDLGIRSAPAILLASHVAGCLEASSLSPSLVTHTIYSFFIIPHPRCNDKHMQSKDLQPVENNKMIRSAPGQASRIHGGGEGGAKEREGGRKERERERGVFPSTHEGKIRK